MRLVIKAERIPGGLADGRPDSDFDPEQLAAGIRVEMEHTSDRRVAKEIAKDHLTEDNNYYKKLKLIEKSRWNTWLKSLCNGPPLVIR